MTYIEREALQEELFHLYDCICHMSTCLTVEECRARRFAMEMVHDALKKMPAADVAPVKRAKWTGVHEGWGSCSNCHRLDGIDKLATHCRFCGAKMDLYED